MAERVPLALLPGLLNTEALWAHQIEHLSDLADPWVADFTTQDSIAAMARSVLEAMPGRFALAGLSMGGYVALEIMATAPERIERLALLDTRATGDEPHELARRRGLLELAEKGEFKGVTPRLLPLFLHDSWLQEDADPRVAETTLAMGRAVGREAFARQQQAIMGRRDQTANLASIACPTLVLCGRQDQPTPLIRHEEMAAAIPDARLVVIEDCGHLSPLERPGEVTDEMRAWLTQA